MQTKSKLWCFLLVLSSLGHCVLTQDNSTSLMPTSALANIPALASNPPASKALPTVTTSPWKQSTAVPPTSAAHTTKAVPTVPTTVKLTTHTSLTQEQSTTSRGGDVEQQSSVSTVSKQEASTPPKSIDPRPPVQIADATTRVAPSPTQDSTTRPLQPMATTKPLHTPASTVTTNNQVIPVTNVLMTAPTRKEDSSGGTQVKILVTLDPSPDQSRSTAPPGTPPPQLSSAVPTVVAPEKPNPELPQTTIESRVQTTSPASTTVITATAAATAATSTIVTTVTAVTAVTPVVPVQKSFSYSLNSGLQHEEERDKVAVCRQLMANMDDGNCTLIYKHHNKKLEFDSAEISGKVKISIVRQIYEDITKKQTDNRTLITILASCGALLLMIIILAVCASHHRKPYSENQQHLTDELQTVENGYHDNPTLEVMEVQGVEPEKKMALNLNGEFNDSWIVPMDNLLKEEGPDEEDTHL